MNNETKKQIKELPGLIARAGSEEVVKLKCPKCGGNLIINFTPGEKKALTVTCEKFCFGTSIDGMAAEPRWVRVLGAHIVTGERSQE
jgi:predicted RNA-binding Zn-ribbon protein involved in translation (DUF1610 family)